jgi:hypothetical protein
LRRIAKEKKQLYVKYKSSHELISLSETFEGGGDIQLHLNTSAEYINSFIEDYESKLNSKKKKDLDLITEEKLDDPYIAGDH